MQAVVKANSDASWSLQVGNAFGRSEIAEIGSIAKLCPQYLESPKALYSAQKRR